MQRRRWVVAALIAGLVLVTLGFFVRRRQPNPSHPDLNAAHAVARQYLRALEARDRHSILELIREPRGATADVDARLRLYGGLRAAAATIDVSTDLSPQVASVRIHVPGPDGTPLRWVENLSWHTEARVWQLILGGRPVGRSTSSIQRPSAAQTVRPDNPKQSSKN